MIFGLLEPHDVIFGSEIEDEFLNDMNKSFIDLAKELIQDTSIYWYGKIVLLICIPFLKIKAWNFKRLYPEDFV